MLMTLPCPVGGADPYCVISCEGKKVKSRVINNTVCPEWGDSALFYRKNLRKPITIQVRKNRDKSYYSCKRNLHKPVIIRVKSERKIFTSEVKRSSLNPLPVRLENRNDVTTVYAIIRPQTQIRQVKK